VDDKDIKKCVSLNPKEKSNWQPDEMTCENLFKKYQEKVLRN